MFGTLASEVQWFLPHCSLALHLALILCNFAQPQPLQIVEVINERKLAQTLSGFIDQIFDKALTETHFAELYADLVAA
jgi:hypothetical protein